MLAGARMGTRKLGNEDGQALVEFALVVPLLLIFILGIVDFGLAYNYQNDETHLANEAIRFAVVNKCVPCQTAGVGGGAESIETFVENDADTPDLRNGTGQIVQQTDPLTGNHVGVIVSFCLPNRGDATSVTSPPALQATATAQYRFLPSFVSLVGVPTQVTITATATQRVEQPYAASSSGYTIGSC